MELCEVVVLGHDGGSPHCVRYDPTRSALRRTRRSREQFLAMEGYDSEDRRLHRTGHGFGLGNHEAPWIAEGSDDRLAENMLISIEPGIYLPGIGGIRHSDTVLVTNQGHELLTRYPMDLDALVIRGWKLITRCKGQLVRRALRLADKSRGHRSPLRNG